MSEPKIWTDWPPLYCEGDALPMDEPWEYRREVAMGREELLTIRRLALARAEASAWRLRLHEERLVADTAIRSLHMRVDRAAELVEAARKVVKSILPGAHNYVANPGAFVTLVELIAELDRHQQSAEQPMERA